MAKRNEPAPHVRKLSEFIEVISVKLTQAEIDEQRAIVCETRDRMDALEEKLDAVKADFKGKAKELEEVERIARKLAATGKKDVEVLVAEYLEDGLDGIQVVRRRQDTMEKIGPGRPATAQERQESLPLAGSDNGFGS